MYISASEGSLAKINSDSLQSVSKAVITLKKGTEIIYDNYNLGLINWGESSLFRTDIIEVEANELYNLTQLEMMDLI
ncbi:MAG: hypothetical protein PVH88_25035 [Ignavibacteria bacterium]